MGLVTLVYSFHLFVLYLLLFLFYPSPIFDGFPVFKDY